MVIQKRFEVFALFLLITAVLIFRVNIESTKYCTPDSVYYLEVSTNILSGLGAVGPKVFDYNAETKQLIPLYKNTPFGNPEQYQKEYFAVWPLGYPACIVAVSYLTTLPPLWASKLVNILLLAFNFYLLSLLFKGSSLLPMYYFGSFTMLEICSYTWSENLFVPFFLLFILALKRIHSSGSISVKLILMLTIAMVLMCLARYASVIFFVVAFAIMLYYYKNKQMEKVKIIFSALALGSILFIGYLYNNYLQSGYLTGMPRVNTQDFTALELTGKFFMGMYHQFHIIKQFRIAGKVDMIGYLALLGLQIILMGTVIFIFIKNKITMKFSEENILMIRVGFVYLVFLIYMTFTSTIDPFDYRTLLPFSFPVFIAVINETEKKLLEINKQRMVLYIKLFFVLSILINMPKKYLLSLLT
jgi:hypothetical protein